MNEMTKTSRIVDLLASTEKTRAEIAEHVGCLPSYVRTVEQRLAGNCAQKRWKQRHPEFQARYAAHRQKTDAEYRRRNAESSQRSRANKKLKSRSESNSVKPGMAS